MKHTIENIITSSGLWASERVETHAFITTPELLTLTTGQFNQINTLGPALWEVMLGLSQIAGVAFGASSSKDETWRQVRKVLSQDVPAYYEPIYSRKPQAIPASLKVDFLITPGDDLRIVEIDAHNKHGLGYACLMENLRTALSPESRGFGGVSNALRMFMKSQKVSTLHLLYGDRERFYLPDFEMLRDALALLNVKCILAAESDMTNPPPGLYMDLPYLPNNPALRDQLLRMYETGEIRFIIPPKPFLGSKVVMPLVRNETGDRKLEAILQAFTNLDALDAVRKVLPASWLIGDSIPDGLSEKTMIMKPAVSGGSKGIIFSDEIGFENRLSEATRKPGSYVLQEAVESSIRSFRHFTPEGERETGNWAVRLIVIYVNRKPAGSIATACQNTRILHGSKEAIFTGVTLV